jgi:hypothetical protein
MEDMRVVKDMRSLMFFIVLMSLMSQLLVNSF